MRITILTIGSHGDVQPYVALGVGLQAAGHNVRLATHATYEELISSQGLDFAPLAGTPKEWHQREEGLAVHESGRNTIQLVRRSARLFRPLVADLLTDSWHACLGAEAIIYSPLGVGASDIAEKLGIPCYAAPLQPNFKTRAFPSPYVQLDLPSGGIYNLLTYTFVRHVKQLAWQSIQQQIDQWRQEILHLPPRSSTGPDRGQSNQRIPFLYGYSPTVVPKPSDWPDWLHVTGYWFLNNSTGWQPPAALLDFLAAGPPPVYIGFGSMISRNPKVLTELVLKTLATTGQRAVLGTGWGGLSTNDLPDTAFKVESVPHDWLFPQMAAVVHHGGAGTTAATLRAGVPSIIVPFFGDQFFWGKRVAQLGVGALPIPQKQLSVERLASAIYTTIGSQAMLARATALSQQIQEEDGVGRAVEAFHRHLP